MQMKKTDRPWQMGWVLLMALLLVFALPVVAADTSDDGYQISLESIVDISGLANNGIGWNGTWGNDTSYVAQWGETVVLQVIDLAGNSQTMTFTSSAAGYTNQGVEIDLSDTTDNLSTMSYSFNGGSTYGTTATLDVQTNQNITTIVKDALGNTTNPTTIVVQNIDKLAPVLSAEISESVWTNYDKTIKITGSDPDATVDYAQSGIAGYLVQNSSTAPDLDDTYWSTVTTWTMDDDGTYWVFAKDNAGNITMLSSGYDAKVDKDAPTIGAVTTTTGTANTHTITVTDIADTGGSGLDRYVLMDSSGNTLLEEDLTSSSLAITTDTNDTYSFTVYDVAGNSVTWEDIVIEGLVPRVESIEFDPDEADIYVGDGYDTYLDYTGTPKSLTYASSDSDVATVSQAGVITAVDYGVATITATVVNYDNTELTAEFAVSVSNVAPTITTDIAETYYIKDGDALTMIVAADGTNLEFEWEYTTSDGDWLDLSSGTLEESTFSISNSSDGKSTVSIGNITMDIDNYEFRCTVSNQKDDTSWNEVVSTTAQFYVYEAVGISTQPVDQHVREGDDATYAVVLSNVSDYPHDIEYQWYLDGEAIEGATEATYVHVDAEADANGATVQCIVTLYDGYLWTNTVNMYVYGAPTEEPVIAAFEWISGDAVEEGVWQNVAIGFSAGTNDATNPGAGTMKMAYSIDGGDTWVDDYTANSLILIYQQTGPDGDDIVVRLYNDYFEDLYTESSFAYKVDWTAPTYVSIAYTPDSSVAVGTGVTIMVAGADDTISGLASEAYSYDGGLTWTDSNEKQVYENGLYEITLRDEAGNIVVGYVTIDNIESITEAVLIADVGELSVSVFGPVSYLDSAGVKQSYVDGGLQVTFDTIPITGQYVVAYVELMGYQFPVTWSNDQETDVSTTTYPSTGTCNIDPSVLTTTSRSTALTINVIMYDDATLTTQAEADSLAMYVAVDMSPPVVTIQYNQYSKVSEISVRDVISGVASLRYTLTDLEGTTLSSGTSATEDFTVSVTESGYITVVATDTVGNEGTTVSSALAVSSTTSGGTTIPDVVAPADETTTTSIYHYKTTLFDCYLINGKYDNVN